MIASPIALNRFGLGGRPNESTQPDAKSWLLAQFEKYAVQPPAWKSAKGTEFLVETWLAQQRAARLAPEGQRSGVREAYLRQGREEYIAAIGARTNSALQTDTPFIERLVHFWSNHFAVSVDKLLVVGLAGGFELDAIRPNVLGRFEDLLMAAIRHPAMLLYLDQAQSIGPNSVAAQRQSARQPRARGLNENLAREILELHTLGVRSGYTQDDVTELARALTGWTLPGDGPGESAGASFRFVGALHEPGQRTVLGRSYPDDGEQQGRAILRDLVASPATAQHIAGKLARHFVADNPPPALVQRLAETFLRTGADLSSVYRELVASPEVWESTQAKFKSPWEWGVSSLRAMGQREMPPMQSSNLFTQLGQPVWRPGSPAGYADLNVTWAAPDALIRRVETAQRLAQRASNTIDARALAPQILPGGALSQATAGAIARADSGQTALALLLVAPEFLRR